MSEYDDTHAFKAINYEIGRPNYPEEFFDYLYHEACLNKNSVIADMGAGTGKITKKYLEKGNKVFALEPDTDMMRILKKNLGDFPNLICVEDTAENSELPENAIDLIFCGNSYHWFDRKIVIPKMQKMVRDNNNHFNIAITSLGPCCCVYSNELLEIDNKYAKPTFHRISNTSPCFIEVKFKTKTFEFIVYNNFSEFLSGVLSASHTPTQKDFCYEEYYKLLEQLFNKYSNNKKIETKFKLSCMLGRVEDLLR